MEPTKFRELKSIIEALAPFCNFECPDLLCTDRERFFRVMYEQFNDQLKDLCNL